MPFIPQIQKIPPAPPMREVLIARMPTLELAKAVDRANVATTTTQMTDALRSVRYWLELAEKANAPRESDDPNTRPPAQG